jgi:hypothetical protein
MWSIKSLLGRFKKKKTYDRGPTLVAVHSWEAKEIVRQIQISERRTMATVADLNTSVTALDQSITTLNTTVQAAVAKLGTIGGITEADLDPIKVGLDSATTTLTAMNTALAAAVTPPQTT